MRASRLIALSSLFLISAFCCQEAKANIEYHHYTYYIVGTGATASEAAAHANSQVYQIIWDIQMTLQPNEWIEETHIPYQGFLSPNEYLIEITVIIGVDTGNCGGGGGGGGGPSGPGNPN
ncbi:MAG: hypothetical protein AAF939_22650 [Planctomycetota bacterium]